MCQEVEVDLLVLLQVHLVSRVRIEELLSLVDELRNLFVADFEVLSLCLQQLYLIHQLLLLRQIDLACLVELDVVNVEILVLDAFGSQRW